MNGIAYGISETEWGGGMVSMLKRAALLSVFLLSGCGAMPNLFSSTRDYIAAIVLVALLVWVCVGVYNNEVLGSKCPKCKTRNKYKQKYHPQNGQTRTNYRTVQRTARDKNGNISHSYEETVPYMETYSFR